VQQIVSTRLSQYCHKLPPPLVQRDLVIRLTLPRIFITVSAVSKGT
jgi:hypothetical protein